MHIPNLALLNAAAGNWASQQYDAIVVGAGPAGIIVATRMAEANLTTLLIEGGGESYGITGGNLTARRPEWLEGTNLTRTDVPGLYKSIFADGGNLTCGALTNAYGGCTIGGSSAINAGLFFEPPASDWDLYHPEGWKSKDMASAISKLYARQPSSDLTSMDGSRYLQTGYDVARSWIVDSLGFSDVDINAEADLKTEVFGHPIFDYTNGQRGGPVTTYLQDALELPNFSLQSGVRVLRVAHEAGVATGVVISLNGAEATVNLTSTGRVVLSAGAIQSPSLLMHSGIGPESELTALASSGHLDIPAADWINSSAVGAGLFDNPDTFIELTAPSVKSYTYSYASPLESDEEMYVRNRSGPYSFASETSVFWDTVNRTDGTMGAFQGTIDSAGYTDFNDNQTITLNIYGTSGLGSRGAVVLDSNGIPGPNGDVFYSVASDAEEIATFIAKIFAGLSNTSITPLNIAQNATVEEITTYITTSSSYARGMTNHWSSSCNIGKCVDTNALVVGTTNIHVVDASIVEPLTVNPQFGVMAAAERFSELILGA